MVGSRFPVGGKGVTRKYLGDQKDFFRVYLVSLTTAGACVGSIQKELQDRKEGRAKIQRDLGAGGE